MIALIKKHWSLITGALAVIGSAAFWLMDFGAVNADKDNRMFDDPKQKHEVVTFVEQSPGPKDQWASYLRDSVNNVHAIQTRQKRFEMERKRDSLRAIQDSLIMDKINRNADQVFQIKELLQTENE